MVQVWVKPTVSHTVAGAGPQVPTQVGGGGVLTHVGLVSVPVAFCVVLSHWFVCVYATPSQIVDGSGSQCAETFKKQVGCPQDMPAITSPATIAGHMSTPHSHTSVAHGQPPPDASSIQWSPSRFVCSPVGDAAMYRACLVVSDSNRNRHIPEISGGDNVLRPAAHVRYD